MIGLSQIRRLDECSASGVLVRQEFHVPRFEPNPPLLTALLLFAQLMPAAMALAHEPAASAPASTGVPASASTPATAGGVIDGIISNAIISDGIVSDGIIKGTIKSGNIPLPGATVTATNTLTGKKFTTTTNLNGKFTMNIPQNGRYVLKTQFAAFAAVTKEVLLNATSREQSVDFDVMLASRAQQAEAQEQAGTRQSSGRGAQNLGLLSSLQGAIEAGAAGPGTGASLPSIAGLDTGSGDSVAISGQQGTTNPLAGIDFNQLRDAMDNGQNGPSGGSRGSIAGGGFGGPGGGGPGGGGFGGGGFGGGGGRGFGNFRNFKPNQPHGALFWNGSSSALNAKPFSLRGEPIVQPPYGSNRFGLTFAGAPYIPKLMKQVSAKDFIFLTLFGTRNSAAFNQYATLPTAAERTGDFSQLLGPDGAPVPIYDPATHQPFTNNQVPQARIVAQAGALLNYLPLPNLPGTQQNYQLFTTEQTNTTTLGARFVHNFGPGGGAPVPAFLAQFMNSKGLRQNINANFNYSHSANDQVNIFPQLGGKHQTDSYSLSLGYTVGYGKLNNSFTLGWNRTNSQVNNFFTNKTDVATLVGIAGAGGNVLNSSPLNYGLPSMVLSQFTGFNQTQPNFRLNQTISVSEASTWSRGKHTLHWGGDYRRVHLDLIGGTNATGTFYFTGFATKAPGTGSQTTGIGAQTGSSLADLLLGLPQETTIQAPRKKAYMRANVWDLFLQDDFRVLPKLTLQAGLRYEYFSPYSEKYNRLANLDYNSDFSSVVPVFPDQTGPYSGRYTSSLLEPTRTALAPRLGFALRPLKDTVVRGGYGINFTNGQYANFIQDLAYQPPFANVQTNEATAGAVISLANGFPAPQTIGNFAVNKRYTLPYIQVWNVDLQRTLPLNIVLNVGYNGSKGTHLDLTDAPGRTALGTTSGVYFNFEDSTAFSNFNALTVRARKRLQNGVSLGATYTYSHSIDNAGSVGGTSTVVAQNWQNLLAEEGNSSFDVRHKISGNYLFELPFGPDRHYLASGSWISHALADWSVSGDFTFATGTPLTPSFSAEVADVARGTAGSLRPDRVPGTSITAGGGSSLDWFNSGAFVAAPAGTYGNASRNSIPGPGTVSNDMSLSRTIKLGDTRSFEFRATANNVFNTVQYSGVNTQIDSLAAGQVTSVGGMRQFSLMARYRF